MVACGVTESKLTLGAEFIGVKVARDHVHLLLARYRFVSEVNSRSASGTITSEMIQEPIKQQESEPVQANSRFPIDRNSNPPAYSRGSFSGS